MIIHRIKKPLQLIAPIQVVVSDKFTVDVDGETYGPGSYLTLEKEDAIRLVRKGRAMNAEGGVDAERSANPFVQVKRSAGTLVKPESTADQEPEKAKSK